MKLSIGENLKKFRVEKNVTQDTLAEYLGVTYQAVSRWENGIAYPDIELLPEIARFFEVSLEELMGCANGEKEAEDKAHRIANRRWESDIDRTELLRELHELERQYPNNWEIKETICSVISDPVPENIEEYLPELRRYGRAAIERFRPAPEEERLFLWFCRMMVLALPEEELDEWLVYLRDDGDFFNHRNQVLKIRYQDRGELEKARHYESEQKLRYLRELTTFGLIPETEDYKAGAPLNERIELIYDAVVGTPYLSADGNVHNSIDLYERADNLFTLSFVHCGSWLWRGTEQEVTDGLAALEKAVDYTLLYADALKGEWFDSENPYLEPQEIAENLLRFEDMHGRRESFVREKSIDWAFGHRKAYPDAVRETAEFQAQFARLEVKKAELEEYWRDRA